VIALHGADSQRLGFFPKGAFEEYARAGQILLAFDERGELLGYLLYRVAKRRAMIAHLCTAPAARRKGVARALAQRLKNITKPLAGIGLRCRQDYDARYMWAKLGFVAINRKVGRSNDGHELTFWWFEHSHADLFSWASLDDPRQQVVINANVFFDLQGRPTAESEASKALLADWVQDVVELCVTKEMLNEIDRAESPDLRQRSKAALTHYETLKCDDGIFQRVSEELKPHFPASAVLRDESDLRQVAYAIAGGASYFVTRDGPLHERCDWLYERYGLHVLHPAELISRLDVLAREEQYRPVRVHGSRLKGHALTEAEAEWAVASFRNVACERVNDFQKTVRRCLSHPREITGRLVADDHRQAILLGVLEKKDGDRFDVPILRITKHPLAATMLRSFLRSTLDSATNERRPCVSITDECMAAEAKVALREFGFTEQDGKWLKLAIRTVGSSSHLRSLLTRCSPDQREAQCRLRVDGALDEVDRSPAAGSIAALEALLWPAKLESDLLPTFIVPIRAEWAQHFFDEELAAELLLGLREDLHLGVEGVYYCSARHRHVSAPARILWYVSKGQEGKGSMCIKACSRLEEAVIGKAGEMFKRYRRLGVYERRKVLASAGGSPDNDILVLRFAMTERFTHPVTLDFLTTLQIRHPFQSPRKITAAQFAAIYQRGFNLPPS
jgi:GNAT superfamily N-acetyltransferase/predicted nucleic acid-binding protein